MNYIPATSSQTGDEEPLYNIGVVSRITEISMATLRAWERRYNFPLAKRTSGGHRLYSERDVGRLRWVKARIDEGMHTSQAIRALRHQDESGQVVVDLFAPKEIPFSEINKPAQVQFQDLLVKALIQRDFTKADQILGEALAATSPEDLILNVIPPVLSVIGEAWENKRISVATEHLATNYLRQRLLMWMVSGPPPISKPPIVLACAPNEWHEGSLLILGAILRRRRWPVAYLGQAVPLPDLATFTRDIKPSIVILVAMTEETAEELVDWPQWLPEVAQSNRPIIGFGGRIFIQKPEWQHRLPGVFLGSTFHEGLDTIDKLLR